MLLSKSHLGEHGLCFKDGMWTPRESFSKKSGVCGIQLNSKESVYYSVAICSEGRAQKSKYCSRSAPAKETF